MMLARTLDEFLQNAPRAVVLTGEPFGKIVLDEDAAVTFTDRFSLDRLVDAAVSARLPSRLRAQVAVAAWSRAIVLRRDDAGRRVAPVLRTLAPALRVDLDRYLKAATPDDRHVAGVFLLLRTPGMRPTILIGDVVSYDIKAPATKFDRTFHQNW